MSLYESVVIARQDIATTQVDTLADELAAIIGEGGGKVTKRENWGLRSLTYRIKKNRKGHYLFFNIDAPPAAIAEYERRMRINEDVLRYLTVAVDALEEQPSAVLQNKGRPEGERGGFFGGRRGEGDRFGGPRRPRDDGGPSGGGRFDSGRRRPEAAASTGEA
jgi:small subunit ribosomal protein S6